MVIYQVLDEQNRPVGEFNDLDYALYKAQTLTLWHTEHYYHVEEIDMRERELA